MTLEEIAREMVACEKWQWMPGMLDDDGERISRVAKGRICYGEVFYTPEQLAEIGTLPDLTDPATLGCVREVVRLAHHARRVDIFLGCRGDLGWSMRVCCDLVGARSPVCVHPGKTEAGALLSALRHADGLDQLLESLK